MLKTAQFMLFFDFLVSEGCLGCSEQASKTLVKKNFWIFFFLRFFDFLTRRWPIQNALVVQKMAGE